MRSIHFLVFAYVVLAFSSYTSVLAAEVIAVPDNNVSRDTSIAIVGEIEKGDASKFQDTLVAVVRKGFDKPVRVELFSPGGDLPEAIKIGQVVRDNLLVTAAPNSYGSKCSVPSPSGQWPPSWWPEDVSHDVMCACNSACVAIWVAGVGRFGGSTTLNLWDSRSSTIGIHRPYFDKSYFAGLTASEAEALYLRMESSFLEYMRSMDAPQDVLEKMMSISSERVHYLTEEELRASEGFRPFFDEWQMAKCPYALTEEEDQEISRIYKKPEEKYSLAEQQFVERYVSTTRAFYACLNNSILEAQKDRLAGIQ